MKSNWKDASIENPIPEKWYTVTFDGSLLMEPNFVSKDIYEETRDGNFIWKTSSEGDEYRVIAWDELPEIYDESKEDNGDWIKFNPESENPFVPEKTYILTIEFITETDNGEISDSYKTVEFLDYHDTGFCIDETLDINESYVILAYQEAPEAFEKEN